MANGAISFGSCIKTGAKIFEDFPYRYHITMLLAIRLSVLFYTLKVAHTYASTVRENIPDRMRPLYLWILKISLR